MTTYGTAGGGLKNPTWLDNKATAAAGLQGELKTAELLASLCTPGVAVLHDLTIPGSQANIDHVVVSGRNITLIDAKVWKPGFYWTFRGRTRRGLERFPPADKRTMPFAKKRIEGLLTSRGVNANIRLPLIAVWSSRRNERVNLSFARAHEARLLPAEQLTTRLIGTRPADERVVAVLKTLLPR